MIYALAPVTTGPSGGTQVMYRHVDILNAHGIEAAIVHSQPGYRAAWFDNATPIVYWQSDRDARLDPGKDLLLLPEMLTGWIKLFPGVGKVVFLQSLGHTFAGFPQRLDLESVYQHADLRAALCVSEAIQRYIQWAYPRLPTRRIVLGIDARIYHPRAKKPQIAFMPRKQIEQATRVFNLMRHRGGLIDDLPLIAIKDMTVDQLATAMGESALFFHFTDTEGFGLPAAEAMACGCVVVGAHGVGGREFLLPEFSFPTDPLDVLQFLQSAQQAIELFKTDRVKFDQMGRAASEFVVRHYSLDREVQSILAAWEAILPRMNEPRR